MKAAGTKGAPVGMGRSGQCGPRECLGLGEHLNGERRAHSPVSVSVSTVADGALG